MRFKCKNGRKRSYALTFIFTLGPLGVKRVHEDQGNPNGQLMQDARVSKLW